MKNMVAIAPYFSIFRHDESWPPSPTHRRRDTTKNPAEAGFRCAV